MSTNNFGDQLAISKLKANEKNGLFIEFLCTLSFITLIMWNDLPILPLAFLLLSVYFSTIIDQNKYRFESHLNPAITIGKICKILLLDDKFDIYYILVLCGQFVASIIAISIVCAYELNK